VEPRLNGNSFVGKGLWSLEYSVKHHVKLPLKWKPFEAEKKEKTGI
jgi:hypothetical protein